MSQKRRHGELREKTQQLLQGSLKHARAAALAAALVPLAAVAASTAVAQDIGSGGPAVPSPCDFATSGGFVITDSGTKANFGAHGGCKNGGFWGHVNFVDHATGYHVNSVEVTGYLTPLPGSTVREICGLATTNGAEPQPVWFRVRLTDNGEPGSGDEFGIRLSNGYAVTPRLLNAGNPGGGNIQLHGSNPSTTAPDPAPDEFTMCGGVETP
ncbi:MAG: post-COAP-1 domain-containing protein [Vicinamibacterales bacterium]